MKTQRQIQPKAIWTPTLSYISGQSGLLQRRCACGGTPGPTGECQACRQKREAATLQRTASHSSVSDAVPPVVHAVLRSPGQPLDAASRAFMEPRFGHDFSQVRVHADAHAAESARAVNALAYTVGRDVVFGAGQYVPETAAGQRLLAHELTHTIQQRIDPQAAQEDLKTINSADSSEWEAEAAVQAIMQGQSVTVTSGEATQLARQPPDAGAQPSSSGPPEWGGFRIDGNSDFIATVRADLNSINATANGREVLQKITENRSPWYKSYIPIKSLSACGFINGGILYNAAGCNVPNRCQGSNSDWTSVPNYVYLFHEVVHAYLYYIAGKGTHNDRECMTTGLGGYFTSIPYNENRLRCELGLPVRPCYNGQCTQFPAPHCPPVAVPQTVEGEGR